MQSQRLRGGQCMPPATSDRHTHRVSKPYAIPLQMNELDRGAPRSRRLALLNDEVAVPREARLRNAVERRVVDVHDPEALRVAERPFEVVEERPEEVAVDRSPELDRACGRREVGLQVVLALGVVDRAVVAAEVVVGRTVL